jgi:hypothetical protein
VNRVGVVAKNREWFWGWANEKCAQSKELGGKIVVKQGHDVVHIGDTEYFYVRDAWRLRGRDDYSVLFLQGAYTRPDIAELLAEIQMRKGRDGRKT